MISNQDIVDYAMGEASEEKGKEINARIECGDVWLRDQTRWIEGFYSNSLLIPGPDFRTAIYISSVPVEEGKTNRSYLHNGGA